MRRRIGDTLTATAVGLFGAAACADDLELPTPPDLSALAATYESPPGMLDFAKLSETAQAARAKLDDQLGERVVDFVSNGLVKLRTRLESSGYSTAPGEASSDYQNIEAVVKIDNTCRGWEGDPTPNPTLNGTFQLTATVEDSALQPIVWGTAAMCRGRVAVGNVINVPSLPDVPFYLDGGIAVQLFGALPSQVNEAKFLVAWDGTTGDEEQTRTGSGNFRFLYPTIEVLVPGQGGDVVAGVGLNGIQLRGSNGTFQCDVAGLSCTSSK